MGEGQLLGLREVRDEVLSPTYLAGLYSPDTCAIVHPAKLAFELARACQEAGVRIYEHTNAQRLDSAGVALRIHSGDGDLHLPQRRAGDECLSRACCGATGCAPCRCTTTCWPPSRSPTRSSTASAGGAGRESATAPTNFTTTG